MENVYIMDHPLIQHKISMLRNKNTGTNEFRKLVEEIGILMGYEALRDLPVEDVEVETPIETCMTPMISGKKLAVVPVLLHRGQTQHRQMAHRANAGPAISPRHDLRRQAQPGCNAPQVKA
mgnify:CR=1 FL=1